MDSRVKVLIVDDSEEIRTLVSAICKRNGWQILFSENGQEAVDKIKEDDDISFIFMDIKMPVMNGVIAAEKIKEFNPSICIIALSSDEKNKYVDNSGGYTPFDDFLSKDDIDLMKNFPLDDYLKNKPN